MIKSFYLPEDRDLIHEMESIKPETAYTPSDQLALKLAQLQLKALLKTRKSYQDASETQDRFNWILLIFTFVQVTLGLLQFTLSLFQISDPILKNIVFGASLVFLVILVWTGFEQMKKSPRKD